MTKKPHRPYPRSEKNHTTVADMKSQLIPQNHSHNRAFIDHSDGGPDPSMAPLYVMRGANYEARIQNLWLAHRAMLDSGHGEAAAQLALEAFCMMGMSEESLDAQRTELFAKAGITQNRSGVRQAAKEIEGPTPVSANRATPGMNQDLYRDTETCQVWS